MDKNSLKERTTQLLITSKKIISDCALDNGAIVAANSNKSYFPEEAKNYFFVWPRDGAYISYAANIIGLDINNKFFEWCQNAQEWKKSGLFYEKYNINGKKALFNFQPDQTGAILWAVYEHVNNKKTDKSRFELLVSNSADALCNIWDKDHFNKITQDLWEERLCFPDLKENFTYSLASCAKGLECANRLFPNQKWEQVSCEMKELIRSHFKTSLYRSFGIHNDSRIDASLLGLIWPFNIFDVNDEIIATTIKEMESNIITDYGVSRYEHDEYDGWMQNATTHRKKGAGYWPLLSFWMSIYYSKIGNKKTAIKYFTKVINDIPSEHIPEQIFNNDYQISVSPLAWSHSMFVIAAYELGIIKKGT